MLLYIFVLQKGLHISIPSPPTKEECIDNINNNKGKARGENADHSKYEQDDTINNGVKHSDNFDSDLETEGINAQDLLAWSQNLPDVWMCWSSDIVVKFFVDYL